MMTSEQCRMARAGLNVSIADLAAATDLRPSTISAFERGGSSLQRTVDALREELERRGAVFFAAGDGVPSGGVGVRLASR
ncbi:helix-turn-helix domain-containing protein [Sphingomonas jinjuensis]|uniref:helix-turn-helix domain-containing protein n=1 Tax=Sphingomonas jinjuensis TaxID=535907 RepID=UPI001620BAC4|nr:helix-turn-helix transcriptional regulator [Sphingomonas jinjuensis]